MALTHGMDIEAVRTSMKAIQAQSRAIDQAKQAIEKEVSNLTNIWLGQDAQKFQTDTWATQRTNLTNLVTALENLVTTGNSQADQQTQTSAA